MNSSDSNPKLPLWLFIATDVALIVAAGLIAYFGWPLTTGTMLMIVGCLGLGVIVCLVPLVLHFERLKNEALDDRQRALEALARTVAASAEQISIAAAGLHEIAELSQKNLRHAEQLPHKLQDKIAEFQAQLSAAEDAEREELERELLSLRTTESERLESVSQRIAKSSADWTKLEAATQQHLAAATEALGKLSLGTAAAIGKAQAAAEQALTQARVEAARTIGEASGQAARAIDTAKATALNEVETRIAAATNAAVEKITRALEVRPPSRLDPAPRNDEPAVAAPTPATPEEPATSTDSAGETAPKSEATPATPKRPKKTRREDNGTGAPAGTDHSPEPASDLNATPLPPIVEPTPVPAEKFAEVAPVAPHTTEPFPERSPNGGEPPGPADMASPSEPVRPPRKRTAPRKPEASPEPGLGLELDDSSSQAVSVAERVISSDGATRLVVTAYIGIGNRLFIRGEGPGLSWEKGVPLQFVSIGKWRWETSDANNPVRFKLYKNDDQECAALGAQTLDPGHQQEVTAAF